MDELLELLKSPAFQFFPKDFLADKNVQLMDNDQLGGYIRLICHEWIEQGLPKDEKELAKLSRLDRRWKTKGALLMRCFTPLGEKLVHQRLQGERIKQARRRIEKIESGRKGAKSRWHSHDSANGKAMANDSSSSSSSSSTAKREEKRAAPIFSQNIEIRKAKFLEKIADYAGDYPGPMLTAFANYWTEKKRDRKLMLCETKTTWELPVRLKAWHDRDLGEDGEGIKEKLAEFKKSAHG